MKYFVQIIIFLVLAAFIGGCNSNNTQDSGSSQLPWAKPTAWENDRTLTANDLSFSTDDEK